MYSRGLFLSRVVRITLVYSARKTRHASMLFDTARQFIKLDSRLRASVCEVDKESLRKWPFQLGGASHSRAINFTQASDDLRSESTCDDALSANFIIKL